jgi:uncharacterized membrane protein YqjE
MDNTRNSRSGVGNERFEADSVRARPGGTFPDPVPVSQSRSSRNSPIDEAKDIAKGTAESLGTIVSGIVEDLQQIVRGEVQLAKTELKEDATQIGKGAGMLGAGVFFGLIGFIFLMLSLTYLLNQWMEMWIAAGIVGLGLVIIAAILAMSGKSQIQEANLKPEETIDSLMEDQEWANRQIKSVKK